MAGRWDYANRKRRRMENAREFLTLNKDESESVSRLTVLPHRVGLSQSFYEHFALKGIRVDRVQPGFLSCTFLVPPRLTVSQGRITRATISRHHQQFR